MSLEGRRRPRDPAGPRGSGRPLEPRVQQRAEAATGRRLDHVRVHDDVGARRWVDGIGALGASIGGDVALGSGARGGLLREAVLAHEVAHAAQSERGGVDRGVISADQGAEADADRVAVGMLMGRRVDAGGRLRPLALRRCDGSNAPPKVQAAAAKTDPAKLADFEKMVKGGVPAADAAQQLQLPKELTDALAEAWTNSFPGGHSKEQGGILIRKSDGSLDWVKATESTSGSTTMPYDKVPSGATPIVAGHTHPYDVSEGGHKGVMFSGGDLGNLATDPVSMKVVHAGDRYFVVTKTKEFEDAVAAQRDKRAYGNQISADWSTLYRASAGDVPTAAREATKAICKKYNLVLYEGQLTGEVKRVDVTK